MPTVSPFLSAGGFMRSDCFGSAIRLDEELSPANDLRRPAQKYLAFPTYRLHAAGSMDAHGRPCAFGEDRRDRGSARSGAGRLGLAHAALIESHFQVFHVAHAYQFDVNAVLEIVMLADLGGIALPAGREVVYKNHEVRVAHGDGDSAHFAESYFDGKFIADLRLSHGDLEFEFSFAVGGQ